MFNLEQSTVQWRQQMLDAGLKRPTLLDELESHLREETARQMKSGVAAQNAFEIAVAQIGQADALKQEFEKIAGLKEVRKRMKHFVLTLAGIPGDYVNTSMNPSNPNLDPGWATYLKAVVFVAPALCLWRLALVGCVPKLKDVCEQAGAASLPRFSRINIGISELITDHWIYAASVVVLALFLLEWGASNWPRYRRAAIGLTAFVLNFSLLVSLFLTICTGAIVAGMAIHPFK